MNFYNDNDHFCVDWLGNLIRAKHLPEGEISGESIAAIRGRHLQSFNQCHFFAGIGGWPYALELAQWPRNIQVWTGSCPCQPFSVAGKRKGTADERHLWPEFFRLIDECRPATIFGEQVSGNDGREWLAGVFSDLETLGYACAAADLCAASVGTPHIRQRLFLVAHTATPEERGRRILRPMEGAEAITERSSSEFARRGTVSGMGDTICERIYSDELREIKGSARGVQREEKERERFRVNPRESSCDISRVEHPSGKQVWFSGQPWEQRDAAIGMEHTKGDGREQWRPESIGRKPICGCAWDSFDIVHCADGKARRIESGTFPLAHGVPGRVGRLRAYGNAIVQQVAAMFIRAFMELSEE